MDSFSFRPSEPTLFYVISREKGDVVATYRSDPCFVFNHINAFEDDRDGVYLDMICYPDDTIARQLTTEYLRNPSTMQPSRLVASEVRRYLLANIEEEKITYMANNSLIPSKTSVTTRIFGLFGKKQTPASSDLEYNNQDQDTNKWYSWMPIASYDKRVQPSIELPQINPKFSMYKHTIMYGLGFSAASSLKDGAIWDSIVKTVSVYFIPDCGLALMLSQCINRIWIPSKSRHRGIKISVTPVKLCLYQDLRSALKTRLAKMKVFWSVSSWIQLNPLHFYLFWTLDHWMF